VADPMPPAQPLSAGAALRGEGAQQASDEEVKARILTTFRCVPGVVGEGGAVPWSIVSAVLAALDPDAMTRAKLALLWREGGSRFEDGAADPSGPRVKLDAFLDWLFLGTEASEVASALPAAAAERSAPEAAEEQPAPPTAATRPAPAAAVAAEQPAPEAAEEQPAPPPTTMQPAPAAAAEAEGVQPLLATDDAAAAQLGRAWLHAVKASGLLAEELPLAVVVDSFKTVDEAMARDLYISPDLPDMMMLSTKYAAPCNSLSDYFSRQMFKQGFDTWSPNTTSYKVLMELLCPGVALMKNTAVSWTVLYSLMLIRVKRLAVLIRAPDEKHLDFIHGDFLATDPVQHSCFNTGQKFEIALARRLIADGLPLAVVYCELSNGLGTASQDHANRIGAALRAAGKTADPEVVVVSPPELGHHDRGDGRSRARLSLVVHVFGGVAAASCLYNVARSDGTSWSIGVGQIHTEDSPFVEQMVSNCDTLRIFESRRDAADPGAAAPYVPVAVMKGMQAKRQHVSYSRGRLQYGVECGGASLGRNKTELEPGVVAELRVEEEDSLRAHALRTGAGMFQMSMMASKFGPQ